MTYLPRDLLLLILREGIEVVIFGADKEGYRRLEYEADQG